VLNKNCLLDVSTKSQLLRTSGYSVFMYAKVLSTKCKQIKNKLGYLLKMLSVFVCKCFKLLSFYVLTVQCFAKVKKTLKHVLQKKTTC